MTEGATSRQIRTSHKLAGLTGDAAEASEGAWCPGRREKPLAVRASGHGFHRPYRTPTLVGRGKDPKVDERSSVKELGKLAP